MTLVEFELDFGWPKSVFSFVLGRWPIEQCQFPGIDLQHSVVCTSSSGEELSFKEKQISEDEATFKADRFSNSVQKKPFLQCIKQEISGEEKHMTRGKFTFY